MRRMVRNFLSRGDGAITVDWVVLTALVVGLSMAGILLLETEVRTAGDIVDNEETRPEPLDF